MTLQSEIENNNNYKKILDKGFVGLVDYMGSDAAIVQAARVSYGDGTKTVNEDKGLIRYLMRHKHTSPFEMCEVKLHIKLPIFVMRQLVRHRTSSLNEYSARYSILSDEFYVPEAENLKVQSDINKQGRSGNIDENDAEKIRLGLTEHYMNSYGLYTELLGSNDDESILGLSQEFNGIARELSRISLPVAGYTELYWKQNLHNLFHLLKLRMDHHAQWEIQEYARAIYDIIKPLFPIACQAFEDYMYNSKTFSAMDMNLLKYIMYISNEKNISIDDAFNLICENEDVIKRFSLTKREFTEFKTMIGL